MVIWDKLDQWRARPEIDRRLIAFWLAVAVTALVAGLWILNLRLVWRSTAGAVVPVAGEISGDQSAPAAEKLGQWWRESKLRIKTGWQTITNR